MNVFTNYGAHENFGGKRHKKRVQPDIERRLEWLYGNPQDRIATQADDLARWRALGTRTAERAA